MTQYELVIGLEIHAELLTESKMFCGAPVVDSVNASPNTAVLPLCLGMPGTLPVVNQRAVELALRVALALNCEINLFNRFARKNYFYPDLPKGYQISQYEEPIGVRGWLDIVLPDGSDKRIRIRRVHMEEDTGKLTHLSGGSLVDYNRAGVPLLEIVTEPDIRSAEEATEYAVRMRQILRYLEVNSGDLEKGVLRVEPNISIRPQGSAEWGTRTEIKNLNSFRALFMSCQYEQQRQADVLNRGEKVIQETRGWDEDRKVTYSQRTKEDAHDYRYFPDPDLPPLQLDAAWVEEVRAALPELPQQKLIRYQSEYALSVGDSQKLTEEMPVALWFEQTIALGGVPKTMANFIINNLFRLINEAGQEIGEIALTPLDLVGLARLIEQGVINNNIAKGVLEMMVAGGKSAETIVREQGLAQISDEGAISAEIAAILANYPQEVTDYRAGKTKLRGFFVGHVMRAMKGKANPELVNRLLDQLLAG